MYCMNDLSVNLKWNRWNRDEKQKDKAKADNFASYKRLKFKIEKDCETNITTNFRKWKEGKENEKAYQDDDASSTRNHRAYTNTSKSNTKIIVEQTWLYINTVAKGFYQFSNIFS